MDTATDYFDKYLKMSKADLAMKMVVNYGNSDYSASIARAAYEVILQNEKAEYDKEQMQRQHALDLKLLQEQAKLNRSTIWITAVATISAALLGATVQFVLQSNYQSQPTTTTQQRTQQGTATYFSATHRGLSTAKVPLSPPK